MKEFVEELWQARDTLGSDSFAQPELKKAILDTIDLLDTGRIRVLSIENGTPTINEWVKKAVLIYIQTTPLSSANTGTLRYYDKIPTKFDGWDESRFRNARIVVLPGCVVRKGSFIGANSVLMPSFVDLGTYIGCNTHIGSWSHIGACVQIGDNCKIGNQTSIEGILNPLHKTSAFIEDDCKIGSKCEIGAGVWIERGAELLDGVLLTATTRIFDIETEQITFGRIPPNCIVSPGSLLDENGKSSSYAAIITGRKE
ncbi:MAG: 2,3,4,5-tetrahydropyridine-2,6-dicarboxylate N-succinyltransferase [Wolinella sp.]